MTKTDILSRRKLLGRIGVLAVAGYTAPALTTLSVAQAGSGPSGGGAASGGGGGGRNDNNSGPSNGPSNATNGPSNDEDDDRTGGGNGGGTGTNPAVVTATCGAENMNDPAYLQCLVDNGF